jgi:hypothetical protein
VSSKAGDIRIQNYHIHPDGAVTLDRNSLKHPALAPSRTYSTRLHSTNDSTVNLQIRSK